MVKVNAVKGQQQIISSSISPVPHRPAVLQRIGVYQAHVGMTRLFRGEGNRYCVHADEFPPEHDNIDPLIMVNDTIHDNYENPLPEPGPGPDPEPFPPGGPWIDQNK
jgi:hypothetical protein